MSGTSSRLNAVLIAGILLTASPRLVVAGGSPAAPDAHPLIDVPYLPQTPELCGGAAVAMVLRYWGAREVLPQDFATLVDTNAGGILTGALTSAVRDRGWQALVVPATDSTDRTSIRGQIDRGRPLVALIEVAPRTYHYVVIVGSTDRDVLVHDPARAPFRVLHWDDFDRAWAAAGRWLLLILPPDTLPAASDRQSTVEASTRNIDTSTDQTACGALVEHSVQMAQNADAAGAEQGLVAATMLCPGDPSAWRELAGLRFTQSRWPEARDFGLTAVGLAPGDAYAWQIVATSRYLMGDATGALAAWNHAGEPRIDTLDISGAVRTPQPVIVHAAGLQPRQLLTPEAFDRALRRLQSVPAAGDVRAKYEPIEGGLATIDVVVDERPRAPSGWVALSNLGARAFLQDEVVVETAGLLGVGDRQTVAWRWAAARPRIGLALALPSPDWLPGIISIDGSWDRQSYESAPSSARATPVVEDRRRFGLHLAEWATSRVRWDAGIALDRLRPYSSGEDSSVSAGDHVAAEGALDVRLAADRVALVGSVEWWTPVAGGDRFATMDLLTAWRSTTDSTHAGWSAVTRMDVASRAAPLALWAGAGTGLGRPGLLRAHPLLADDVVAGPVFGRRVSNLTVEYAHPVLHSLAAALAIAGFVDAARAWERLDNLGASPTYVDAGVGLRLHAHGAGGGVRIDVAHGVRGGGFAVSARWDDAWPR